MRLGIAGKGGVGKTTISAVLARTLARRGRTVIAVDCDSNPNLGVSIGIGEDGAERLRPFLDQSGPERSLPGDDTPSRLVADYGRAGPDDVTMMLAARAEKAGSG